MAKIPMPAVAGDDFVISMNYDPTGLASVTIFDNAPLGWLVDDAGLVAPAPVIVGALPPAAPDTAPVLSPQWAYVSAGGIVIPDVWRGKGSDFLDWLSGNNGASRKLSSHVVLPRFVGIFESWAYSNPAMVIP